MIQVSEKAIKRIEKQAEKVMTECREGVALENILMALYIQGMPEKTEKQAAMMTAHIIEVVEDFRNSFKEASEDLGSWLDNRMTEILSEKPLEVRCDLLYRMLMTLTAAEGIGMEDALSSVGIDLNEIRIEGDQSKIRSEAVSEALENTLKSKVVALLFKSNLAFVNLETMVGILEIAEDSTGQSALKDYLADQDANMTAQMAIASMIAYVDSKNGIIHEIPPAATVEEITIGVCAAIETERILADVSSGSIAEESARLLIRILSAVVSILVIAYVALLIGTAIPVLFSGLFHTLLAMGIGTYIFSEMWQASAAMRTNATGHLESAAAGVTRRISTICRTIFDWFKNTFSKDYVKETVQEIREIQESKTEQAVEEMDEMQAIFES